MSNKHSCCDDHNNNKSNNTGYGNISIPDMGLKSGYYTCPMHPEVKSNTEGMCPECGMKLVYVEGKAKEQSHDKHKGHKTNIFKMKFWISLFLSIPVVLYSDIVQQLLNWSAPKFPFSEYLPLVLSTIIFFYGGWVFIVSAYREIKSKMPGMMTLISIAITVAYAYSIYVVFSGQGRDLFWELSTLIVVMLLGHWIEMRAVKGAQNALQELSKLLPEKAFVERDGREIEIDISELKENDIVIIKPGSRIPADGIVIEGQSEVDESIVTGESKLIDKFKGDDVIAGTINSDGLLKIKVSKIGEDTFLANVIKLVREAQASKSKLQLLSDRAAYYLTIVAVITSGVTLASWMAVGDFAFAVERVVAVLVIACPHALGLAVPLIASISTTKAAQNGFLVKQRLALEAARNIDVVLFDKTGTLTKGEFGVSGIVSFDDLSEDDVLKLAGSVNKYSEHPLARAMVKEAENRNIKFENVSEFQRIPGKGAKAVWNGKVITVGSPKLLDDKKTNLTDEFRNKTNVFIDKGHTVVYVFIDNSLKGAIALADVIREESREAVKRLHDMGVKTSMITGDDENVAKWVAQEIGLDSYFARVMPEDKVNKVKELQNKGYKVAMVGDGVNDAPALMQADLGIAIGAGTNVAIESAGIILVKNDPRDIVRVINLSKLTYTKMIQNLWWAAGYNIVAIPLAAGVLAFKGVLLQPAVAAVLMSLSTVIVSLNALILRNKKI